MQQIDYDTVVNLLMYAGRDDILVAKPKPIAAMPAPEIRKLGNEGAVFFLPEDAPVVASAQQEMEPEVAALSQQETEKAPPQKKLAPRKPVDSGKIMALHKAGRSAAWIADDMKISKQAVYSHLKKMKEMEEKKSANEN